MASRTSSPLRYPGGKSCLYDLTGHILRLNRLERAHYAEPYAGGGGLALSLLFGGHVSDIHLNDIDRTIWAFWTSILTETKAFVEKIATTPVDMDEWHSQREIYLNQGDYDDLTVGFATFFLNRTNRSGIIKGAGVIGGMEQQGNYKIDCRFNREELIRRVNRISKYKSRIHFYRSDALLFLEDMERDLPTRSFFCIDPPYYNKGSSLYTSFYNPADHLAVSQAVLGLDRPWILTYDNTPEISYLYKARRQFSFDVNYSVQTKRIGTELLVASKGLILPNAVRERLFHRPQYRSAA
ncbi:DNA adenine methylase [Sphingobium fluviale]|uniref:site-specific DNA-methyltransferase (adenine-specific) n=1 Tax=Sphingobium fluviale TaxID=2506423 RepID=A0A4Q1KEL1_9SPHN|nr:DNA adenine methylase [Sphingobium fluviale]RXR24959.1 DNA adenine methylase [Sphingobium fluviale]